jgi:hypothetical protein
VPDFGSLECAATVGPSLEYHKPGLHVAEQYTKRSFGEESTVTPLNATPSQLLGFTRHSTEHFRDKVCWPPLRLDLGLKLDAWDKGAKAEYIA